MALTLGLAATLAALVVIQALALRRPVPPIRPAASVVLPSPLASPTRRRQAVVAAIATGAVLRLLWVIWATRAPQSSTDPSFYLQIASDFGHGYLPRFAGLDHSAYWPPGYPFILAPFVWVSERTGWISPAFVASLVNVVAGTLTVWLSGLIARRWMGPRAQVVAVWLVALCPALIYFSSTAHADTVFTPLLLGAIVLCGRAAPDARARTWVAIGLLFGAAFLVRTPGVVVLAVPALSIRAGSGSWRGALRATGLVVLASAVLLVPWTIRNGVQVGIWTPSSTNNAAAACMGNHDGTRADWGESAVDPELTVACFRNSPYDDPRLLAQYEANGDLQPGVTVEAPDEATWYREKMGDAIAWAATHPFEELRLSVEKAFVVWSHEGRAVDSARNYQGRNWAGSWHRPLGVIANLWLWIVGCLALLGLAFVPRCRRALPVWFPVALLTLAIAGGVGETHYRYPVVPLVVVLAAGFVCRHDPEAEP